MDHVTCCWQEVAACPAAGKETCTLTFGDILTLPIRSLLSFVRPDELVRVSTWDGEVGQTGPHLGSRQTSISLLLFPAGFSCIICYQATAWELFAPQLKPGLVPSICIHLKRFIIRCLSLCKLCCRGKNQTLHPYKRQMLWSAVRAVQLPR